MLQELMTLQNNDDESTYNELSKTRDVDNKYQSLT